MSSTWPLCFAGSPTQFLGHTITCNPLALRPLRVVELRSWRSEYGAYLERAPVGETPTGCLVCRNRRPYPETPVTPERHSEHAHGVAIDVNWDDNPLSPVGVLVTDFDRFGYADGCDWLEAWLEPPPDLPVFFRWGGGWTTDLQQACLNLRHNGERIRTGVVDGMHFELALTPDEVRRYDWNRVIDQEEAMNEKLKAAADFTEELRRELKPGKDKATVAGAAERTAKAVLKVESGPK